jgi:hypothetical protein
MAGHKHASPRVFILQLARTIVDDIMTEETRYYKGKYKVKVVNETKGYWTVEALEEFTDSFDGCEEEVKVGDRKIVPSNTVHRLQTIPPPIKEHSYELEMEKKLKRLVTQEEGKDHLKKKKT